MISIVIPLYNKELSVKNTVMSVLNQTYRNFELLIINDGSTDNSLDKLIGIEDQRIKIINQKNSGVSAARNKGISEARYSWIAFLDADDLWINTHLETIIHMINLYPNESVFVTSFSFNSFSFNNEINNSEVIYKVDNYFHQVLSNALITSSNVVINSKCFKVVGGFNELLKYGEDLDMWARLSKYYNIIKTGKVTAIYRTEAENRNSFVIKDVEKSHIYYLNLNDVVSEDEFNYYKILILDRMYICLRFFYIINFMKLKKIHSKINYFDILLFIFKKIFNKFFKN